MTYNVFGGTLNLAQFNIETYCKGTNVLVVGRDCFGT